MILGRDLITSLVLDINFSYRVIIRGNGPYKGCSTPMVDVNKYNFKYLKDKNLNRKNHLSILTLTNDFNHKYRLFQPEK